MKKIFSIIALAAGAFGLTGCTDFLDQQSPSEQTDASVWESTYYTSLRVNKLFGDMMQDRTYSQDLGIVWRMNSDCELVDGLGSNAYNTSSERGGMNYNLDPGWARLSDVWTNLYGTIEDANLNIRGIRNSSLINGGGNNQKAMERYLGESLTIRALSYLELVRFYGDVPMKLEPSASDLINVYLYKTDRDEILNKMMEDLDEAIGYLPWADEVSGYTTEHVTKGYAHALLAQIALTRAGYAIRESAKSGYETAAENSDPTYPTQRPGDAERKQLYERALKHLTAIIQSGKHQLNPSIENQWALVNQLTLDQNYHENLFEIPMGQNVSSELGYTVGVRLNGITAKYGYGNSSGKMKVTAPLLYSYDPADQRRDLTVAAFQIAQNTTENITEEQMLPNAPFGLYVGKWDPRKMSDAWLQDNLVATAKHMTGINPILMRYSQVLLYYAEVMNELAGPDAGYEGSAGLTAREALAQVHARAFKDKSAAQAYINAIPANKTDFFNAIVDENAWELAGEGMRKADLVRWNLLVKKTKEMKETYLKQLIGGIYQEKVYFNYLDAAKSQIDFSSITWYGIPAGKTAADYAGSADSFGKSDIEKETDTQVYTNLPSISCGLLGEATVNTDGTITYATPAVQNRYIMPIGSTIISAANGSLHNSYGYSD